MNIVDLLTLVIVVAILVAGALVVGVFLVIRLRRSRSSAPTEAPGDGNWFFVLYEPDEDPHEDA